MRADAREPWSVRRTLRPGSRGPGLLKPFVGRAATIGATAALVAALAGGVAADPRAQSAQTTTTAAPGPPTSLELPAVGWTCPMHREVFERAPGTCPICGMALVPTRLEIAWSCPLHAAVLEDREGRCPVCGRALRSVTVEVAWVCPVHPEVAQLEPGRCPVGGEPLERRRTVRPHEDHTPKHGGIFFMAPDNWHHLEGVYPEPGVFRVYLYDNYSRPLDARGVQGRAVTKEEAGEGGAPREVAAVPLVPAPDGAYLEARVDPLALPAAITAKIRFDPRGTEDRFDFIFPTYSSEPARPTGPAAGPLYTAPAGPAASSLEIPETVEAIAREIATRDALVRQLVDAGAYTEVFVPALEAKDLALALGERAEGLAEAERAALQPAVKQLVRAAWLLDWYGDLGNREEVRRAYQLFAEAAGILARAARVP